MGAPGSRPQLADRRPSNGGSIALTGARVLVAPGVAPVEDASVLVQHGRIAGIGTAVRVPPSVETVDVRGGTVTAGFWNAHVHFTEAFWERAATAPPGAVESRVGEMLSSRGFTSVIDVGSDPRSTLALRARIDTREVRGPRIYSSGSPLYPPAGVPYYLRDTLPPPILDLLPQPSTPDEAVSIVDWLLTGGSDLIKLFTGSWVARGTVLPMSELVASAAVKAAHRKGRLVFTHPSDRQGTEVAAKAGVDVLAHAPDRTEGVDDALLTALVNRGTAMIPTLKMFETTASSDPAYLNPIYDLVARFRELGGALLFGTDVGYMRDYTTEGEFAGLRRSGVPSPEILAMLTTNPVRRFGVDDSEGIVAVGAPGDLTVLGGDPLDDVRAFSQVRFTIRDGYRIWPVTSV